MFRNMLNKVTSGGVKKGLLIGLAVGAAITIVGLVTGKRKDVTEETTPLLEGECEGDVIDGDEAPAEATEEE